MSDDSTLVKFLMNSIETVRPSREDIQRHITDLKKAYPNSCKHTLANKWADSICKRYASEGAVSALPGSIPGFGTMAQIGVEGTMVTADLAYMIRCMAGITIGVGIIYDRDTEASFNQDFVRVLGLWCGVLSLGKETTVRITQKVAISQFNKIPGKVFQTINRKVGTTIITKYGTKRGGVAIGRLIPFGVGALVGGGFNLFTMKQFKKKAIEYYSTEDSVLYET